MSQVAAGSLQITVFHCPAHRAQQGAFAWCQFQRLAQVVDGTAVGIGAQAAEGGRVVAQVAAQAGTCRRATHATHATRAAAPGQRAHPRFQFVQVEGLGQVVVGAGVQAQHAVAHGAARGQDQHRRAQAARAGFGQHLQTVQRGQRQVKHHGIGRRGRPALQRRRTVAHGGDAKTAPQQRAHQRRLQRGIVFNHQQFHARQHTAVVPAKGKP